MKPTSTDEAREEDVEERYGRIEYDMTNAFLAAFSMPAWK
jgi:hypothetical protein